MSTVLVDADTAEKLLKSQQTVEIRTENGCLVGVFTPLREANAEDYEWARQYFSKERVEEARRQEGGMTTAEVLAHLYSLTD